MISLPKTPLSVADGIARSAVSDDGVDGFVVHHRISHNDRAQVLRAVFLNSDPRWASPFVVMLALSAGVATLGLSQNSAATVIGSMIIAPLGAPIVGLGGAVAAVWPRQIIRMTAAVLGGAALVVAIAYVLGLVLPDATPNAQILARTSPDLRDLGVAVFAGAAGGYTYTRPDLSSSLVGVAIAVALVPPLGAVGLMLEEGRWTLAQGALTLFTTNLFGITLSVAVVLLTTRFVPLPRFGRQGAGLAAGIVGFMALTSVIMIPLSIAYGSVVGRAATQTDVYTQAAATVGGSTTIAKIDVNGSNVRIHLDDPTSAPEAAQFEADLVDELGPDVNVTIE